MVGNVSQSSHPTVAASATRGPSRRPLRAQTDPRSRSTTSQATSSTASSAAPLPTTTPASSTSWKKVRLVLPISHPRVARGPKSPPIWIFPRPPPAPRPRNGRVPAPSRPLTARISSNHDPAGSAGRDPAPDRPRTRPVERVVPNKLARFARPSPPGAFPVVYPSVSLTTHHLTSHPNSIRLPQQPELLPPLR